MELILSFLPLPVLAVVLVGVGVGTVLIRKYTKSQAVKDVAQSLADAVVTRKRVDQTVEAILAKLRIDPSTADKIGDLIAELIGTILDRKTITDAITSNLPARKRVSNEEIITSVIKSNPDALDKVAAELVARPTVYSEAVKTIVPDVIKETPGFQVGVARSVVEAYAMKRVH